MNNAFDAAVFERGRMSIMDALLGTFTPAMIQTVAADGEGAADALGGVDNTYVHTDKFNISITGHDAVAPHDADEHHVGESWNTKVRRSANMVLHAVNQTIHNEHRAVHVAIEAVAFEHEDGVSWWFKIKLVYLVPAGSYIATYNNTMFGVVTALAAEHGMHIVPDVGYNAADLLMSGFEGGIRPEGEPFDVEYMRNCVRFSLLHAPSNIIVRMRAHRLLSYRTEAPEETDQTVLQRACGYTLLIDFAPA